MDIQDLAQTLPEALEEAALRHPDHLLELNALEERITTRLGTPTLRALVDIYTDTAYAVERLYVRGLLHLQAIAALLLMEGVDPAPMAEQHNAVRLAVPVRSESHLEELAKHLIVLGTDLDLELTRPDIEEVWGWKPEYDVYENTGLHYGFLLLAGGDLIAPVLASAFKRLYLGLQKGVERPPMDVDVTEEVVEVAEAFMGADDTETLAPYPWKAEANKAFLASVEASTPAPHTLPADAFDVTLQQPIVPGDTVVLCVNGHPHLVESVEANCAQAIYECWVCPVCRGDVLPQRYTVSERGFQATEGERYRQAFTDYTTVLRPQMTFVRFQGEGLHQAILDYVDSEVYGDLNAKMCSGESLDVREERTRTALLEAFRRVPPLAEPLVVYRGLKGARLSVERLGCQFVSTTTDYDFARREFAGGSCCLLEITIQPGAQVLPLAGHGTSYELEVLLPPGGMWTSVGEEVFDRLLHYELTYAPGPAGPPAPAPAPTPVRPTVPPPMERLVTQVLPEEFQENQDVYGTFEDYLGELAQQLGVPMPPMELLEQELRNAGKWIN